MFSVAGCVESDPGTNFVKPLVGEVHEMEGLCHLGVVGKRCIERQSPRPPVTAQLVTWALRAATAQRRPRRTVIAHSLGSG